jgi:hypothetical protein
MRLLLPPLPPPPPIACTRTSVVWMWLWLPRRLTDSTARLAGWLAVPVRAGCRWAAR